MMLKKFFGQLILILVLTAFSIAAAEDAAVPPDAQNWAFSMEKETITVTLKLPAGIYAYADKTGVEFEPASSAPAELTHPAATDHDGQKVYLGPGRFIWTYSMKKEPGSFPLSVDVKWQACSERGECFLPGSVRLADVKTKDDWLARRYSVPGDGFLVNGKKDAADGMSLPNGALLVPAYEPFSRTASGYMTADEFLDFLTDRKSDDFFRLDGRSLTVMLLLILLGGLALNLTPCVLPLIPVNLTMIGAGKNASAGTGSRILRGLTYGVGIAVSYGIIGAVAVLTGSTFGAIASNWIVNAAAAIIFLLLALAQFDVFLLDFSRFGSKLRITSGASVRFAGIFLMGALSAVLAGACVAPVLVAVLIQSAGMYAAGNHAGLFLPFLLGIGMALPWPFAAAGLAILPKPGAWMVWVKRTLGILIVLLAAWYAWTAFTLLRGEIRAKEAANTASDGMTQIANALETARDENKQLLVIFGASWCKNCTAMHVKTLQNEKVKEALEKMIVVDVSAEDPSDPATAAMLEQFGVKGLPGYVILNPLKEE